MEKVGGWDIYVDENILPLKRQTNLRKEHNCHVTVLQFHCSKYPRLAGGTNTC